MKILKAQIFKNYAFIFIVFLLAALFIAIQQTFLHESNNYKIFFYSLRHLVQQTSLYAAYPAQHLDYFLYSPTFPIIFSPIFILPFNLGAFLWHLLFASVWVFAIYKMPLTQNKKVFMYWYCFQELLTALGNSQTNPLIAAIPLFAFASFEKNKPFWAAFFIILGFEVKIYSLVCGALFLLYPQKGRFILFCIFWLILFTLLPLAVTSPSNLFHQYGLWFERLVAKSEFDKFANLSINRVVYQFFNQDIPPLAIVGSGIILFCSVFIHTKVFLQQNFRMLLLSSILIFQVIFNPTAESAAYITAVTGVTIWWLYSPKKTIDVILVISCYILTVTGHTDLMPAFLKKNLIWPYALKAWPCIFIWFRVLYLMHLTGFSNKAKSATA